MRKIPALLLGLLLELSGSAAFGQSAQMVAAAKKEGGKVDRLYVDGDFYRRRPEKGL